MIRAVAPPLRERLFILVVSSNKSLMKQTCFFKVSFRSSFIWDKGSFNIHFFFWAAFVTFPPEASAFSTDLMTPTATVCFISRTAKRPSGGYSEKDSTHMGLDGMRSTIAASPDLTNLGISSSFLPDRRSHFSLISWNLQAMWAV